MHSGVVVGCNGERFLLRVNTYIHVDFEIVYSAVSWSSFVYRSVSSLVPVSVLLVP